MLTDNPGICVKKLCSIENDFGLLQAHRLKKALGTGEKKELRLSSLGIERAFEKCPCRGGWLGAREILHDGRRRDDRLGIRFNLRAGRRFRFVFGLSILGLRKSCASRHQHGDSRCPERGGRAADTVQGHQFSIPDTLGVTATTSCKRIAEPVEPPS